MLYVNQQGDFYQGDLQPGDREATDVELASWQAIRRAGIEGVWIVRAKDKRKLVLDALTGIAGRLQRAGDAATAVTCDQMAVQLLAVDLKGIAAQAADDAHFDAAVMLAYRALAAGAPAVVAAAFKELS